MGCSHRFEDVVLFSVSSMASLWATFTNQAWWRISPAPPTLKQWALKQQTIIRFESEKSGWHVRRACGIWRLHLGHCQLWSRRLPAFLHFRGQFTDQQVEVSPTVKRLCSTSKSLMGFNSARIQWPAWQEHPREALPSSHGRLRIWNSLTRTVLSKPRTDECPSPPQKAFSN